MNKDRDYYRCKPSAFLIEEAKYEPNAELCIALGERLADTEDKLYERITDEED